MISPRRSRVARLRVLGEPSEGDRTVALPSLDGVEEGGGAPAGFGSCSSPELPLRRRDTNLSLREDFGASGSGGARGRLEESALEGERLAFGRGVAKEEWLLCSRAVCEPVSLAAVAAAVDEEWCGRAVAAPLLEASLPVCSGGQRGDLKGVG